MAENRKKIFSPEDFDKAPIEKPHKPRTPKYKTWFWMLLVLCILGGIAYFLLNGSSKEEASSASEEENVVVEEVAINASDAIAEVPVEQPAEPNAPEAALESSEALSSEVAPNATVSTQQNSFSTQTSKTQTASVSSDVEAEAMKVIRGDYGVGQERKDKLGDKYQPIQDRVNELKREGVF